MHVLVGVLGAFLVLLMLTEIFVAFLLPRRIKRDPALVRTVSNYGWLPWRAFARRLPAQAADTMLGIYGPFGLVINLVLWVAIMMFGYACLQWAFGSHLGPGGAAVSFGNDVYFAAATMTTDGPPGLAAHDTLPRIVQIVDAGSGLAVLAIVIGYLPSLYQALSRREARVSQLDARAGTPPSAGRLVLRAAEIDGWVAMNRYLSGWEPWVADLMETHLAYPVLAYFRSQHVNQNWLAAICCVLDACAFTTAAAPPGTVERTRFTFAIARHAVADLSYSFRVEPTEPAEQRLSDDDLSFLLDELERIGLEPKPDRDEIRSHLAQMRAAYEPYVNALATRLELAMPPWLPPESPTHNWRTTQWH